MEEVEGTLAERWTGFGWLWRDGELARPREGCGGNGASVLRLGEHGKSER
jgi:hypothetical protein